MEIKGNFPKKSPSMIDIMRQHYEENLRDEMAKSALIGIITSFEFTLGHEGAATAAYLYADAMIKARKEVKS